MHRYLLLVGIGSFALGPGGERQRWWDGDQSAFLQVFGMVMAGLVGCIEANCRWRTRATRNGYASAARVSRPSPWRHRVDDYAALEDGPTLEEWLASYEKKPVSPHVSDLFACEHRVEDLATLFNGPTLDELLDRLRREDGS